MHAIPEWPEVVRLRETYSAVIALVIDYETANRLGIGRAWSAADLDVLVAMISEADREVWRITESLNVLAGPGEHERFDDIFAAVIVAVGSDVLDAVMPDAWSIPR